MLALLAAAATAATPYLGVEWRPLSRGDLAWVEGGNTTGVSVGGSDGFVRPQLAAYGGAWVTERVGVHGGLGIARLQTTTWEKDVYTQRHWGVLRPAIDVRASLLPRVDPRPIPWVVLGAHVDIPSARDTSNGYTKGEQVEADRTAAVDRARLGAIGSRIGVGADVGLLAALRVGVQWTVDWQRSLFLGAGDGVSSFVSTEGALILELVWHRHDETGDETAPDTE